MSHITFAGVEAVLFDFEGTLVDHQWNRQGAIQETVKRLQALGFPVSRIQGKKYSLLKNEVTAIASEIGQPPAPFLREIDRIYDQFDEDALSRWSLRPLVTDFLSSLKTYGIQTGLVTNLGARVLSAGLKKLNLSSFFNIVISRNDVNQPKPNGEGIRLALHRLGLLREKALFIGDSLDDLQAAKEAGVSVIIILGGENSEAEFLARGADVLIQSYGELIASLKENRG
jgi:HAD superfamily hydrolase (TIGR01509 family)